MRGGFFMAEKSKTAKNQGRSLNINTRIFLKTQVLSLATYIMLFLLTAVISLKMNLDEKACFYAAIFVFALSSFVSGYFSGYKVRKNGLVTGLVFALPANAAAVFISLACSGFKADFTILITLMILLISSMLGGVLSVNTRLKAKRK